MVSCLWAGGEAGGGGPRARTRCGRASPLLRHHLCPIGEGVLVPRVKSEWILFPLSGCFLLPHPRDPCPGAGAVEAHVGSSVLLPQGRVRAASTLWLWVCSDAVLGASSVSPPSRSRPPAATSPALLWSRDTEMVRPSQSWGAGRGV